MRRLRRQIAACTPAAGRCSSSLIFCRPIRQQLLSATPVAYLRGGGALATPSACHPPSSALTKIVHESENWGATDSSPGLPFFRGHYGVSVLTVLTDNISKYKEFIVTCNTNAHCIRPLVMKLSSEICHNYHKSELTTTRFYCFINGKIKKELEKPWIG